MRRDYFLAPALAVLLHLALAFAIRPYGSLMVDVGGIFVHGNDIADIPNLLFAGVAIVGVAWIAVAVGIVAVTRSQGEDS
jgi:hypothetical protein